MHIHEQPAEDDSTDQALSPGPFTRGLDRRAEYDLQRIHVNASGAHGGAGIADQAIALVFEQIRSDLEVTLGQGTGDAHTTPWPLGLVQRQHVRRARRQAEAAADAGQHVVVLGIEPGVNGFEGGWRSHFVNCC